MGSLTSESVLIIICIISKNVKDMDIKELKEYVDAKVKENGRQEITGPVLNKVLNSAIDTLSDTATAEVAEAVAKLEGEVTAEATARETADNTLQSAIDAEASARESADTAITSRVAKLEGIPVAKGTGEGALVASNLANTSSGKYSFAEGDVTKAEQRGSHAEGASTTASAIGAHAEGESTTASGRASHSEGYMSTASGKYAHAEGTNGKAEGTASHVEGDSNTASGEHSHAEGYGTKATNYSAHCEGSRSIASGYGAHSEGYMTEASGEYSHCEGKGTVTAVAGGHAEGLYNEDDSNLIHSVGVGANYSSGSGRKNAEAIYTNGKKYVYGIGNYNGTKASIASGAKDVATVIGEATVHIASTDNPHKVTASQVGASTPAEVTSAIATHNTASNAHSDIREEVANCVKLAGASEQTITGELSIKCSDDSIVSVKRDELGVALTGKSTLEDDYLTIALTIDEPAYDAGIYNGVQIAPVDNMVVAGDRKLAFIIEANQRPSVRYNDEESYDLAYITEVPIIRQLSDNENINNLRTANVASYYHNANKTISGTLPDSVSKADRFRLEVLPLGDSYVEQRMTVPTNGTVAVYSRVWNGSSWGAWV